MADIAAEDPDALPFLLEAEEEKPDIDPTWDWIWGAWWRLGAGDRPYLVTGMGVPMGGTIIRSEPGFIPWTAVQAWAERHELGEQDTELLDRCVQALDTCFRSWWIERSKVTDGK